MKYPQSHKYCSDIVKKRASNFGVALRFLPLKKRQALNAIYAFARLADDIADGDNLALTLDNLKEDLEKVYSITQHDSYGWQAALQQAIRKFHLEKKYFEELLEGMNTDLNSSVFETWHETKLYCYRAASTIGLLSLKVFGHTSPKAISMAKDLGIAMQLTNILRDLKEDYQKGRQYLPQEDFDDFEIKSDDLIRAHSNPKVLKFLRFQIDRTSTYFESSKSLYSLIDRDARFCPKALSLTYQEYINLMKKDPNCSLKKQITIPKSKKFSIVIKSYLR